MTPRGRILEKARNLTEGDRNKSYGSPEPNMYCFAQLVQTYLVGAGWTTDHQLDAVDGAMIMSLAKISRIAVNHLHTDNYVDLSAYSAIAGECAGVEIEEATP